MADFIAAHGYLVVIPDYYRGEALTLEDLSDVIKTKQFINIQSSWEGQPIG